MKPLAILVLTGALAWSQSPPSLHARELFYSPTPTANPTATKGGDTTTTKAVAKQTDTKSQVKQTPAKQVTAGGQTKSVLQPDPGTHVIQAGAVPLGLRYAVLKRDTAGKFQDIDPETAFRAGDRIRLQIDSNTTGYLYVVMQGSSGNWQLLFPSADVGGGSNRLSKGQSLQIPPGDRGQFVFDETAGTEKIFLVLTRQPEQDLDKLIYSMRAPTGQSDGRFVIAQSTVRDDVITKLRSGVQARDLVFEKVDSSSAAPVPGEARVENAAYVVNPSTEADARLVVDIALRHR